MSTGTDDVRKLLCVACSDGPQADPTFSSLAVPAVAGQRWHVSAVEQTGRGFNLDLPWCEGVEANGRKISKSHYNFKLH